ncbi:DUF7927 domain-containing protein [Leucobacter sp. HY1908]
MAVGLLAPAGGLAPALAETAKAAEELTFGAADDGSFSTVTLEDGREFGDVAVGDGFALGLAGGALVRWSESAPGAPSTGSTAADDALAAWRSDAGAGVELVQVAAGGQSAYAVTNDGALLAWNGNEAVGDGPAVGSASVGALDGAAGALVPATVDAGIFDGARVEQVVAAGDVAAVRTDAGTVYAWGVGLTPSLIAAGPSALDVAALDIAVSPSGSLAVLLQDGSVLSGQIASSGVTLAPIDTSLLQRAPVAVQATSATVTVLTDAGSVFMSVAGSALVPVEGLTGVRALAAGAGFTLALSGDGVGTSVSTFAAGVAPQIVAIDGIDTAGATAVAAGAGSVYALAGSTVYGQRVEIADDAAAVESGGAAEGDGTADEQAPDVEEVDGMPAAEQPAAEIDDSAEVRVPELSKSEQSGAAAAGPSSFMRLLMAPLAADGVMPLAGTNGCHYANAGTGAYAESLCWLDLTGFTTEWVQDVAPVTTSINSTQFNNTATCPTRVGSGSVAYARTTATYRSLLGAAYGQITFVGCGRGSTSNSANNNSVEAMRNSRNASIFKSGAGTNNDTGPFYGEVSNWPIEVELPGGYKLSATISSSGSANNMSKAITSHGFPTWPQAVLGTKNFYTGVAGEPALYTVDNATGFTELTLNSISLADKDGVKTAQYAIVVADAESTDQGEKIEWTTSGGAGFTWLPNNPAAWNLSGTDGARRTAAVGNDACLATPVAEFPAGNSSSLTRYCNATPGQATPKNGTAMLQTRPVNATGAFQVKQKMSYPPASNGRQAVAFGVIFAKAEVKVSVDQRILNSSGGPTSGNFTAKVATASTSFSAETTTSPSALSGTKTEGIPVDVGGTQLTFTTATTDTNASSYSVTWACTKTDPLTNTTTYWPAQNQTSANPPSAAFSKVQAGEVISCEVKYTPPYLTLVKDVNNSTAPGAANTSAHWNLTATGTGTNSKFTVPGSTAVKQPVAVGTNYALTEDGPTTTPWQHGYAWRDLTCAVREGSGSTAMGTDALKLTRDQQKPSAETGEITAVTLNIAKGNDLRCTYKNDARKPDLKVKKESSPASTTTVAPESRVDYTLTFDNNSGTAKAATGYTDYLADVLDDADLLNASDQVGGTPQFTVAVSPVGTSHGVTAVYDATAKKIAISGDVPAYAKITVKFGVKVKANETDAVSRAAGAAGSPAVKGYRLNNYLAKASDPAPTTDCVPPTGSNLPTCTNNPVRAWSVRKDSQPQDGAVIHSGGNIYYRVTVTNYSGEALTGVVVQDDMSETLAATTLDLNASPIAGLGAVHGVNFYNAAGVEMTGDRKDWKNLYNQTNGPELKFTGSGAFDPSRPGGKAFPGGTWTYKTPAITFPAGAVTAVIGYVVKGGSVASPLDPSVAFEDSGAPLPALPNAVWVNTVQAQAAKLGSQNNVYPNRCNAAAPGVPTGDVAGYYDCKTWHELGDSYFHLWKKSSAEGAGSNPTGKNLVGSTFVLADTEALAAAGTPSRWLCRTNNNPNVGAGYVAPGSDPSESGTPDFGENSATWAAIAAWNLANPGNQKPQCGLFYALTADSQGQAAGSWRALDVRGGDLDNTGTTPLTGWRTGSAANGGNAANGRHGTYWVAEMKSPTNHQLLAQPFKLWVAPAAPTPSPAPAGVAPGSAAWYDYQGRLSMPVVGAGESAAGITGMPGSSAGGEALRVQCADAWALPANNQPACVMPTGWTAPIFDAKLKPLPLTGGNGTVMLTVGGAAIFVATLAGVLWWRRRKQTSTTQKFN